MPSFRHKSGSQKRKERAKQESKSVIAQKGQATLATFNFRPIEDEAAGEGERQLIERPVDAEIITPALEIEDKTEHIIVKINEPTVQSGCEDRDKTDERSFEANIYNNALYDIGTVENEFLLPQQVEDIIRRGHTKMPTVFPRDRNNENFSVSLLFKNLPNGERVNRDWLVWSKNKSALFCLPCRLFSTKTFNRSHLCSAEGFSKNLAWKKLYERLPSHENNDDHMQCYVKWRGLQMRVRNDSSIDKLVIDQIRNETKKWKEILTRILDTILFLGERGLALRGDSHLIGECNNGNFLGILELIGRYDPVLFEHLEKVKASQQAHQRLQVHYLSPDIQNEFIDLCAHHVVSVILKEREKAKYYSIIVDATPDSAHIEQTTFVLRYLRFNSDDRNRKYTIVERFLAFVDCNQKTGSAIADLIRDTLKVNNIPLSECRGQGYDNGSNMRGEYNGAKSHILRDNPLAVYSPCAAHSLNLCGVDSAECCRKAITFFGVVQKCYKTFSSSPMRWEILKAKIGCSLHSLSDTRWSSRIDAVKPFANHLPGLQDALENLSTLNLTAETKRDVAGIIKYIRKFECILMASIWSKILSAINARSTVLQARNSTIDIEVENLDSLLNDLQQLREKWDAILNECKLVAGELNNTSISFPVSRKKKRARTYSQTDDEDSDTEAITEETEFKKETFFVIIDSVISGISNRFKAMRELNETFSFLWKFVTWCEKDLRVAVNNFVKKYEADVSDELFTEIIQLKEIYAANFDAGLSPFDLLNEITSKNLDTLFSNICVALRIFCTLPVSVASGERSFSLLSRIKDFHRSCSTQTRVTGLGTLCLESALARKLDFGVLINTFASSKARKAHLQ